MKKIISAIICIIFVFSCMQLPVYASSEEDESDASPRLSYIYDAQVSIGKNGNSIRVSGSLSCNPTLTSFCSINLSIYSRDKGSSDSWTYETSFFANGSTYCSGSGEIPLDTTKEYRGRIYCSAHPIGGGAIEHATTYTNTYKP